MMKKRRKPRSDCNYIIYEATDDLGNNYIGLTRKTVSTSLKSVKVRWSKHVSRAKCDNDIKWSLYETIRENGFDHKWKYEVIEVIRGRKEAYKREREIILSKKPNLNEQYIVDNCF